MANRNGNELERSRNGQRVLPYQSIQKPTIRVQQEPDPLTAILEAVSAWGEWAQAFSARLDAIEARIKATE